MTTNKLHPLVIIFVCLNLLTVMMPVIPSVDCHDAMILGRTGHTLTKGVISWRGIYVADANLL